jgi:undecaprenyl-diphosphatase
MRGAIVAAIALIVAADVPLWQTVAGLVPESARHLVAAFSDYGLFFYYGLFGGMYGYGRISGKDRLKGFCWVYIKAQVFFSFMLVRVLKIAVGRGRPDVGVVFSPFSLEADYNSFPSGHSADVFVGGVVLYLLLKSSRLHALRHLPLIYAGLLALSRIIVDAHYPSDVIAGAAIGVFGVRFFGARQFPDPLPPRRSLHC